MTDIFEGKMKKSGRLESKKRKPRSAWNGNTIPESGPHGEAAQDAFDRDLHDMTDGNYDEDY